MEVKVVKKTVVATLKLVLSLFWSFPIRRLENTDVYLPCTLVNEISAPKWKRTFTVSRRLFSHDEY